jgi:hypothetical protein
MKQKPPAWCKMQQKRSCVSSKKLSCPWMFLRGNVVAKYAARRVESPDQHKLVALLLLCVIGGSSKSRGNIRRGRGLYLLRMELTHHAVIATGR